VYTIWYTEAWITCKYSRITVLSTMCAPWVSAYIDQWDSSMVWRHTEARLAPGSPVEVYSGCWTAYGLSKVCATPVQPCRSLNFALSKWCQKRRWTYFSILKAHGFLTFFDMREVISIAFPHTSFKARWHEQAVNSWTVQWSTPAVHVNAECQNIHKYSAWPKANIAPVSFQVAVQNFPEKFLFFK
jgi:hypothetical protein